MTAEMRHPPFVRAIDWLSDMAGRVAIVLVVPLVLVSSGNAVVRYAVNYSSNGWLEIQWYLFAAIFLLGASYALKHNAHVRIDLLYHHLPQRAQAVVDLITLCLFLLPFAVLMTWLGWPFFHTAFTTGEISSNVGGLIRWPVKALVPLGMLLLSLQGLAEVIKRVRVIAGAQPLTREQAPIEAAGDGHV